MFEQLPIPFELWAFGIIVSFALTAIGFLANPRIHIMIMATAFFLAIFAFIPSALIMGYYTSMVGGQNHYDVESSTGQVLINAVTSSSRGERITNSASALVGDTADCITVFIGRSGSPPNTTLIKVGVMDSTTAMIKQFGSMNVTQLISSATQPYQFCLPIGDTYTFNSSQQVIGIQYPAGDGSNTLTTRIDANDPFDSSNTEHVNNSGTSTSFSANSGQDIMTIITLRGETVAPLPILYQFNESIRLIFVVLSVLILLASIILVAKEN